MTTSITKKSNPDEWSRLKAIWEGERRPGFVVLGATTYQVLTPNGENNPVFCPYGQEQAYGSVSVGNAAIKPGTSKKGARK